MITSAHNPKLKLIRRLLASRRQRESSGLFVCEGEDLVEAARAAGIEPVELLVAGEDVEPELLAERLDARPPAARARRLPPRGPAASARAPLTLALWHVADPGNVGTLLRTADAFGAGVALSARLRRPDRAEGAARVGRRDLPRAARRASTRRRGRGSALVAHGGDAAPELELGEPATFVLGAEREGLPDDVARSAATRGRRSRSSPARSR